MKCLAVNWLNLKKRWIMCSDKYCHDQKHPVNDNGIADGLRNSALKWSELKTSLKWNDRFFFLEIDWNSRLCLREADCNHCYKSHLNNYSTVKRLSSTSQHQQGSSICSQFTFSQVQNQTILLLQKKQPQGSRREGQEGEKRPLAGLPWNQTEYSTWLTCKKNSVKWFHVELNYKRQEHLQMNTLSNLCHVPEHDLKDSIHQDAHLQ